ncbi:MAG: PDZ domain-containing protein [Saprospiraceae bacterium]
MIRKLIPILFITCFVCAAQAQTGFRILDNKKYVEIPFEYKNNFIILTINFKNIMPLRFVFDTGAEHTVLAQRSYADLFNLPFEQEFRVAGSDLKQPLIAYLVRKVPFLIPDKIFAPGEDILVLQEDYFRFEEYAGIEIHGILSANAFSNYIIRINYQKRIIELIDPTIFKVPKGFEPLDIELSRNKIYLNTNLEVATDSVAPAKLLIDTGAGMPLLLFTNTHPLLSPPDQVVPSNIGMGLGGYIEGYTGRIKQLDMLPFKQTEIVTYFQELDSLTDYSYLNKRNGLIGNTILERFILTIDYNEEKIYLKPSRLYSEKFLYDRSGISVIASGEKLNHFMVSNIVPKSPAADADIRRGDQLLRVGGFPSSWHTLHSIQSYFLKKAGKKLVIVIRRDGKRIKKKIVLRDLI